jgi:tight adherence protein C
MNVQIIIPILAALASIAIGGAVLLIKRSRRAPMQQRLRSLLDPSDASSAPLFGQGRRLHGIVESVGTAISKGQSSRTLQQQLSQAGYHHPNAATLYIGIKGMLFVAGAAPALLLPIASQPHMKMLFAGMLGALLFFIPNIIVTSRREKRRGEIRRHLPDAIDLLEICASSGMGLDMSWNSVSEEVRSVSSTLADEMALTTLEIHLGATRAIAMRNMAQRTGAEELSSLVAVLVQSERFGTSIRDALRTYATALRESRSQRAQESAEKMAVKLIFPMVVFIFPAVVMVMAGPGFMVLYKALRAQ